MKTRNRGFTLIEVLIALAILAIALVAFVSAGAQNAEYATYIHNRTIGQWVARDQLVEYQLAPNWPQIGVQSGNVTMGGQRWHWQATIKASPDPQIRRVDMRVFTVDPSTGKPATDSILVLSGFLSQHPTLVNQSSNDNTSDQNNDADHRETAGNEATSG